MKKFIYIFLLFFVIIVIFKYIYINFIDNVNFKLILEIPISDYNKLEYKDWYIINKNIEDENFIEILKDIDFEKNSIIISKGEKIEKIKYMRQGLNVDNILSYFPIFKYKAIKVYVNKEFYPNKIYIYLVEDPDIYEDMRYIKEYYTIIN